MTDDNRMTDLARVAIAAMRDRERERAQCRAPCAQCGAEITEANRAPADFICQPCFAKHWAEKEADHQRRTTAPTPASVSAGFIRVGPPPCPHGNAAGTCTACPTSASMGAVHFAGGMWPDLPGSTPASASADAEEAPALPPPQRPL